MLTKTTMIGALSAVLLAATPALAVTITNQDAHPHTLTVDRGANESQQTLAPGASVNVTCPNKCGFHDAAFGYSRLAGGDAKLVIDNHALLHFANGHGDMDFGSGTKG